MAEESRLERPARRGRMDDSGGDTDGGKKLYYHLTVLAENDVGYRNLIQLSSRAFLEGYYYKARIDWELLAEHSEGVIATTGCLGGHVLQSLLAGDERAALAKAGRLPGHLRATTCSSSCRTTGWPSNTRRTPQLVEIARKLGAPLLATNDSHYVHRDDHVAHDALLCVQTGSTLDDPNRFKFQGDEHYLKSAAEMRSLFSELPRGVRQHAVGGRAGVGQDRVRQAAAAQLPAAGGLRHRRRLPARPRLRRRPRALRRHAAGRDRRAPRVRARRDLRHGVLGLLPHRVGPHPPRQEQRHPRRSRRGRRRAASWPTRCASSTSIRCATASSSSASSTRAASRCPTSTWTSTSATAAR